MASIRDIFNRIRQPERDRIALVIRLAGMDEAYKLFGEKAITALLCDRRLASECKKELTLREPQGRY